MNDFEFLNTRMYEWFKNKVNGLAKLCDIVILNKNKIVFNNENEIKTIFVNTKIIYKEKVDAIDILLNLLKNINHKVNVIIAGEDWTFPNSIDIRMNKTNKKNKIKYINLIKNEKINKIFVENLDQYIDKNVIPIPLGVNSKEGPVNFNYYKQYINKNKKRKLLLTNFNRISTCGKKQCKERILVKKYSYSTWKKFSKRYTKNWTLDKNFNHHSFLKELAKYPFTICVHGGGLDPCPKLWEALIVGTTPIIKKNIPLTNCFKDLPVIIIDEWKNINYSNLIKWYNKYNHLHFNEKFRKNLLEKLSLNYWYNKIKN